MAKKKRIYNLGSEPEEYAKNSFGKVVSIDDVLENTDQYADIFSEGSAELKKLLVLMWNNHIETVACCAGHPGGYLYKKDTIWGQKDIDRNTYFKHMNSNRYHRYVYAHPSYLMFRLNLEHDSLRTVRNNIFDSLKMNAPSYPCEVSWGYGAITVRSNRYLPEPERERFFSLLSDVLSRELGLELGTQKKIMDNDFMRMEKDFLDDVIAGIESARTVSTVPKEIVKTVRHSQEERL